MDKNEFTHRLSELMPAMTEEEIERAIESLKGCRAAVYRRENRDMCDLTKAMGTTRHRPAQLRYTARKDKTGVLRVYGASLLTETDYKRHRAELPSVTGAWWLCGGLIVQDGALQWWYDKETLGKIRPVLILESAASNLTAGNVFYVNDEKFRLLTDRLAIRTACLEDRCTNNTAYDCSVPKLCVDGWYERLIRENRGEEE